MIHYMGTSLLEGMRSKSQTLCLERGQSSLKRIKILAIVGSLRKDSYNRQLAMLAKEIVGDRADFEILEHPMYPCSTRITNPLRLSR